MVTKYEENVGPAESLSPQNAALLLIDQQVGLMQLVGVSGDRGMITEFPAWARSLFYRNPGVTEHITE